MVTRKDIAQAAGVSVSVVSRALNNSGYVDAKKKERILEIAKELEYRPNPMAISLTTHQTKHLIFFNKDMRNAFNIELYEGMRRVAERKGFLVAICGSLSFSNIKKIMADGLILPNDAVAERYLKNEGKHYFLPVVAATYGVQKTYARSIPIVDCDLWEGANKLFHYLIQRGHHKIAFVSPYAFDNRDARFCVWKDHMRYEVGDQVMEYFYGITRSCMKQDPRILNFPEEQGEYDGLLEDNYFDKGKLAADVFQKRNRDATAVLCFNDEMAYGFYKGLQETGIRVPEDVSVVGIDGSSASRYSDHPVTTLKIDAIDQGSKCVEVLLDMIEGKPFKYKTEISTKILEYGTVASRR
ncbi:MAG: LacI family transcriptional regulator [Clostridiales bacterium]|nr:LacI family transcriptional regulator [Clostridiales bacterium]